jgi:DNA polymerase (family X)
MEATVINRTEPENNRKLAFIFHRMAACYRYLGTEERFRATAYENVANGLHTMKEDIALYAKDIKTLDAIRGIGESIAEKIIEYLHTGSIKIYEELKKKVPYELLELMDINGFGPATIRILHEELGINNKDDLIKALNDRKLEKLRGFDSKKIENMQRALKLYQEKQRLPLAVAEKTGNEILELIRKMPGVQRAELAGSLRRRMETIGDIDIIILAEVKHRARIVNRFISLPQVKKMLVKGSTKASVVLKEPEMQVDIRLVHDYEYGAAMLYFTGNKEHNIKLRTIARNKGYKINEYGIFDAATNKKRAGATEEEMYSFLGLHYIPPEQRLGKGEIEKAMLP